MADDLNPIIGQLAVFPYGFTPKYWTPADGRLLNLAQYRNLFIYLGNRFGGDGKTTFALPDLRGRTPMMQGGDANTKIGQSGGEEFHTLSLPEVPGHRHPVQTTSNAADSSSPGGHVFAAGVNVAPYASESQNSRDLHANSISSKGGGKPHENRTPFLAQQWCIAIEGLNPKLGINGVFVGEMILLAHDSVPPGTAICNGTKLSVAQNTALFRLLGNRYGGDGQTDFALPNIQGRIVVGQGQSSEGTNYTNGDTGGTVFEKLSEDQVQPHSHSLYGIKGAADQTQPDGNSVAGAAMYAAMIGSPSNMAKTAISSKGGGQQHNNMMPYVTLNWLIAISGTFPPRS